VLVQINENSAILTPFGSLVRSNPAKVMLGKGHLSSDKSRRARHRALFALLFRRLFSVCQRAVLDARSGLHNRTNRQNALGGAAVVDDVFRPNLLLARHSEPERNNHRLVIPRFVRRYQSRG
jgi:hypothetical protein